MTPKLEKTLEELPDEPGCYLMKDKEGAVVYVGKAASLRSRVRQYFPREPRGRRGGAFGASVELSQPRSSDSRAFVALLDDLLSDVEVIVTRSEKEAVLLEPELVKKHKPRFNVELKDDKDFIVLRLDESHPWPRIEIVRARQRKEDGARYFGPYSSASSIRETLRVVNRWFQLRTCSDHVLEHRKRPCILYQIGRCPAPCVYDVPPEQYRRSVRDTADFLEGRDTELVPRLRERMVEAARELRFEEAARLRDQLGAVERSLEKQRVSMGDLADRDLLGLYREGPDLVVQVLSMRGGKLQDSRSYPFQRQEFPDEEILSSFLSLYYDKNPAPDEVLVPAEPSNADAIAEALSERRGRKVRLFTPQRGAKADLLEVAAKNAQQSFKSWREQDEQVAQALDALVRALHLARAPRWIECYDISTFQGALSVGSGVSLKDGKPDKANYRRYKVKGKATQDDFAALYEVVTRRLKRAVQEGAFPDLVVLDGGKGQLNAALAAARDLGVPTKPAPGNEGAPFVEMVGLAKSRLKDDGAGGPAAPPGAGGDGAKALADLAEAHDRGFKSELARSHERVFLPNRKDPIVLRQNSAELFMLTRLRDEAHRFAITFHRKLRISTSFTSVLEQIPGVGAGRKRALLRHFGSLRRVREARAEELAAVEGFGAKQAQAVYDFFHPPAGAPGGAAAVEQEIDRALAEEEKSSEPEFSAS